MKKPLRRRDVTSRQKEGIYRASGNEPVRDNRQKPFSKRDRIEYGRSEEPKYENMGNSMRDERSWDNDYWSPEWMENVSIDRRRDNNRRSRSQNEDSLVINEWDERLRRKNTRHDNTFREEGPYKNDRSYENLDTSRRRYHTIYDNELYEGDYVNIYGEHPSSRGREEYLGSNKRHPGLLGNRPHYNEESYWEDDHDIKDEIYRQKQHLISRNKNLQPRNHKNDTRLAIRDYMNRGQYETPFQPMQMYDPEISEFEKEEIDAYRGDDFIYRDEGYQHGGNIEGFGKRGGRQQGHDWLEEDEYREGHAPRYGGYGKYGSR